MSKFTDSFSNFFNKLGFWFTGGDSKGKTPVGRLVLLGLLIMTPIFLIGASFWLRWISISPEHRYDAKYNWIQDMAWIWPLSFLGGVCFLGVVGWLIYSVIQQSKVDKANAKFQSPQN